MKTFAAFVDMVAIESLAGGHELIETRLRSTELSLLGTMHREGTDPEDAARELQRIFPGIFEERPKEGAATP